MQSEISFCAEISACGVFHKPWGGLVGGGMSGSPPAPREPLRPFFRLRGCRQGLRSGPLCRRAGRPGGWCRSLGPGTLTRALVGDVAEATSPLKMDPLPGHTLALENLM